MDTFEDGHEHNLSEVSAGSVEATEGGRGPRRRGPLVLTTLLVVGFLTYVVASAQRASVPVGASSGMPGMSMPSTAGGGMTMSLRDVDGRRLRLPDGRPGAVVFVEARNCPACVRAARRTAAAVRAAGNEADLTIVSVDSKTTRDDVRAFARAAGHPRARYVVDDADSSLVGMFGASGTAQTVVYDRRGAVTARPAIGPGALRVALRRATASGRKQG